jgi:regulator of chromosome condensation
MAQLGLKSSISERQNPQPIPLPELVIQIASGPLHSVCLTEKNQIFTFGCNDEHALGRADTNDDDDDEANQFGLVDMSGVIDINQEKIIQIVAGDSHTLVLSNFGKVYGKEKFCCQKFYSFYNFNRLGYISFKYNWCLWSCKKRYNGYNSS